MQYRAPTVGIPMICGWLALSLLHVGCVEESREAADDRIAVSLLADVEAGTYREWAMMPGFEDGRASNGPHGQTVEIYVNQPLAEAIEAGGPWPVGAIAVKDGYADGDLLVRAIARRDDDGWFFAQFDRGDRIIDAGREVSCLGCHTAARGYLISPPDPAEAPDPSY